MSSRAHLHVPVVVSHMALTQCLLSVHGPPLDETHFPLQEPLVQQMPLTQSPGKVHDCPNLARHLPMPSQAKFPLQVGPSLVSGLSLPILEQVPWAPEMSHAWQMGQEATPQQKPPTQ
jgi:hypothetical protein